MNQKEIGLTFKDQRKKLGLTLEELAENLGKSKGYLSKFENGLMSIQVDTLDDLCKAYGLDQKFIGKNM